MRLVCCRLSYFKLGLSSGAITVRQEGASRTSKPLLENELFITKRKLSLVLLDLSRDEGVRFEALACHTSDGREELVADMFTASSWRETLPYLERPSGTLGRLHRCH